MPTTLRSFAVLAALVLSPSLAHAGWVLQWQTAASTGKGEKMPSQKATQSIADNQVRMDQPEVITIIDYSKDRFVMMNPTKQFFWSGTTDDFVREMTRSRDNAMREKIGSLTGQNKKKNKAEAAAADPAPKPIDVSKLPPVSITPAGAQEKIAGYDTQKYEVRVNGDLFEELWIAPLDISADVDPERLNAQLLKNSAAMQGKSADAYNALYRDAEYRRLTDKAMVLKTVTHHVAGSFERTATSVEKRDVPASTFAVPDTYRKVRLSDLLDPPPAMPAANSPPSSAIKKN
jgi:hypothetical protein